MKILQLILIGSLSLYAPSMSTIFPQKLPDYKIELGAHEIEMRRLRAELDFARFWRMLGVGLPHV